MMQTDPQFILFAVGALATILNPVGIIPQFLAFTSDETEAERRAIAGRAAKAALLTLIVASLGGTAIFGVFGISLPAFRVAGGVLLFLISLHMLFVRRPGTRASPAEDRAGAEKDDIAVFPVAIPLIAGPGSLATVIMLGDKAATWVDRASLVVVIFGALLMLYLVLRQATRIQQRLGVIGMNVLVRLTGLILASIAAQFVLDGVKEAFVVVHG